MRIHLKVEPYHDELARVMVESQRPGIEPYLVDILGMDCSTTCPCEHYIRKLGPMMESQMSLPRPQRRIITCIHGIMAREWFLQSVLWKLKDAELILKDRGIIIGHRS